MRKHSEKDVDLDTAVLTIENYLCYKTQSQTCPLLKSSTDPIFKVLPKFKLSDLIDYAVTTQSRIPILIIRSDLTHYSSEIKKLRTTERVAKVISILSLCDNDIEKICCHQLNKILESRVAKTNDSNKLESILTECPNTLESYINSVEKLFMIYESEIIKLPTMLEADSYYYDKYELKLVSYDSDIWKEFVKSMYHRREVISYKESLGTVNKNRRNTRQKQTKSKILVGNDRIEYLLAKLIKAGLPGDEFKKYYHFCSTDNFKNEYLKKWAFKLNKSSADFDFVVEELAKTMPDKKQYAKIFVQDFSELYNSITELRSSNRFPGCYMEDYYLLEEIVANKANQALAIEFPKVINLIRIFNNSNLIFDTFVERFFRSTPTIRGMVSAIDSLKYLLPKSEKLFYRFVDLANDTIISRLRGTDHAEIIKSSLNQIGEASELGKSRIVMLAKLT